MNKSIPDRIFLQWFGTDEDQSEVLPTDTDVDEGEVTWCRDRLWESDVEYVRATPARKYKRATKKGDSAAAR